MLRVLYAAAMAACVMSQGVQAEGLDSVVEPAAMFKLDFGGKAAPAAGFALRLNYSTEVRQSLARLAHDPDAREYRLGSNLFGTPALGQLDFNHHGFRRATLVGLPLVTRHVRNQTDAPTDGSAAEVAAEASAEGAPPAEDAAWYDYGSWGWKGWTLAAAGAVGAYVLLSDDDDEDSAPATGGGGGGGGEETPDEGGPLGLGCDPTPLELGCV